MNYQEQKNIRQCIDEILRCNEFEISWLKSKIELFEGSSQDDLMEYQRRLSDEQLIQKYVLMMKHSADPKLYINFINSMMETKYVNLLDALEHCININYQHYGLNYDPETAENDLVINVLQAKQFRDRSSDRDVFPMKSYPRFMVLMISQTKYDSLKCRDEEEINSKYFKELFRQIGGKDTADYSFITLNGNLTADKFREVVKNFSKKPELRKADSCIVYLFGHGGINKKGHEIIYAKDYIDDTKTPNSAIEIKEIIYYFSVENCPSLASKPKIFFIDACRVGDQQMPIRYESSLELLKRDDQRFTIRGESVYNYSDILVVNSTHNHCFSHDTKNHGSLFSTTFCEIAMKRAWKSSLEELVKMTQKRMSHEIYPRYVDKFKSDQVPDLVLIRCYKDIYFNPGLFE